MGKRRRRPAQAGPGVERASKRDRAWFDAHPGAQERLRPAIDGEFDFAGVTAFLPSGAWVRVVQLAPGCRLRELLT